MQSAHHLYKKICSIDDKIIFTHSVGRNDGTHLCVYLPEIDVYQEIEKYTYEFTIHENRIYYIKSSDQYMYSHRSLYKCDLDGANKTLIKDLGKSESSYFDIKISGNKLYYKKRTGLWGALGVDGEETGVIDLEV